MTDSFGNLLKKTCDLRKRKYAMKKVTL